MKARLRHRRLLLLLPTVALLGAGAAQAAEGPGLSPDAVKAIKTSFEPCVTKRKGPYHDNTYVCADGSLEPVQVDGKFRPNPCGKKKLLFHAAFLASWGKELQKYGIYVGGIFSRDLYYWDDLADKHAMVRGYILEKFFTENFPKHKLSQLRKYGGLSGAENEIRAAPQLFEKYLELPDFTDGEHYLLAYDLQRRFYARGGVAQIDKVRGAANRIESVHPSFKLICDMIHNKVEPSQVDAVAAFRDALGDKAGAAPFDELIAELEKLTALSDDTLRKILPELSDAALRGKLEALLPPAGAPPVASATTLGRFMAACRDAVAAGAPGKRTATSADARRLIDLAITASAVMHARLAPIVEGAPLKAGEALDLMTALTHGAYGAGLLSARERDALAGDVAALRATPTRDRRAFHDELRRIDRIAGWAQQSVRYSFQRNLEAWTTVIPEMAFVGDDVIRASPLLLFAQVSRRLEDHVAAGLGITHDIAGVTAAAEARVLNAGLAVGPLLVDPEMGKYGRRDVVALRETPADLGPVAGILTASEGNAVSHVQLLARNLGIPNVSISDAAFQAVTARAGKEVLLLATPLGRVIVKERTALGPAEQAVLDDYTRNVKKGDPTSFGAGAKLHIDTKRLDLKSRATVDLGKVRRKDSGISCGPKAAYLGELKFLFPDAVSRGVVIPFGAYWEHYGRARVTVPAELRGAGEAAGPLPLADFLASTYATFFGKLVPAGKPEPELAAYIKPRLELVQKTIRDTPLSPELESGLRASLEAQGLLPRGGDKMAVGCFVRSDTNVEDLETFTGAGLNLTVFNMATYPDICKAVKDVWASPFSYRSFAWRQSVIDEPSWVLPSIVVLESVPSEKSGVMITADIDTGDAGKLLIATSEGVGGAVDGSPAETLLVSSTGTRLLGQFKSPWRRVLKPEGGSAVVASTGRDTVLEAADVEKLAAAAKKIGASISATKDASGTPRPWDVEYGFVGGKLWLFQVRPFVGNDEIKNVPALKALDRAVAGGKPITLEEPLP